MLRYKNRWRCELFLVIGLYIYYKMYVPMLKELYCKLIKISLEVANLRH